MCGSENVGVARIDLVVQFPGMPDLHREGLTGELDGNI